jgi:hypothetical protein
MRAQDFTGEFGQRFSVSGQRFLPGGGCPIHPPGTAVDDLLS